MLSKEEKELFLKEAKEMLGLLQKGIEKLEINLGDREALQQVYRAAHSLQGSTRVVIDEVKKGG